MDTQTSMIDGMRAGHERTPTLEMHPWPTHEKAAALVEQASYMFRMQYPRFMDAHLIERRDVDHQAWLALHQLEWEWPTNPGKYLLGRLIDWMRACSRWGFQGKYVPRFTSYDVLQDERTTGGVQDVERAVLVSAVRRYAGGLSPRHLFVIDAKLAGYSLRATGEQMEQAGFGQNVKEARACQLYQEVITGYQAKAGVSSCELS